MERRNRQRRRPEILITRLRCPVCQRLIENYLVSCAIGHTMCLRCRPKYDKCPTCNNMFEGPSNMDVTNVKVWKTIRCKRKRGCKVRLPTFLMPDHKSICPHKNVKCILHEVPGYNCQWEGKRKNIIAHVKNAHKELIRGTQVMYEAQDVYIMITDREDEIFLFRRWFEDEELWGTVKRYGLSRKFYTCQIIFEASNSLAKMVFTFVIPTIESNLASIQIYGQFFRLKNELLNHFERYGRIEITVKINGDPQNRLP